MSFSCRDIYFLSVDRYGLLPALTSTSCPPSSSCSCDDPMAPCAPPMRRCLIPSWSIGSLLLFLATLSGNNPASPPAASSRDRLAKYVEVLKSEVEVGTAARRGLMEGAGAVGNGDVGSSTARTGSSLSSDSEAGTASSNKTAGDGATAFGRSIRGRLVIGAGARVFCNRQLPVSERRSSPWP